MRFEFKFYFPRIVVACLLVLFASCNNQPVQQPIGISKPVQSNRVIAVSYALQYLTKQIAGDEIAVELIGPNESGSENWTPPPAMISSIQSADLIVTNAAGIRYAKWLQKITVQESKTCNSALALELDDLIQINDHKVVHKHGNEGEHSHPFMVPYTWLNPVVAKRQAQRIRERLSTTYPESAEQFDQRFKKLAKELDDISGSIAQFSKLNEPASIISANPNLKYLTRAMGVIDNHLLCFEDSEWAKNADRLARIVIENKPTILLVPVGFNLAVIDPLIEPYNLKIVEIHLLGFKPEKLDFAEAMRFNIRSIADGLQTK